MHNYCNYIYTMGKLEVEIQQQQNFGNEYEKVMVNILYTSSWLYNMNVARMKKHSVTPEQYNVLRILRGSAPKPLMLGDITSRMIDKSSNATRLVEKLRQKGLVDREICKNNRRQVDINITPKGLLILKNLDAESDLWIKMMQGINKKEAQQLNKLLDKLRK